VCVIINDKFVDVTFCKVKIDASAWSVDKHHTHHQPLKINVQKVLKLEEHLSTFVLALLN